MAVILVTGATGFVGRAVLPRLTEAGHSVRCLVRPSRRSPRLPVGVPVQLTLGGLADARSLRSALAGVDTVIHLAGVEWQGRHGDLHAVDVQGTRALAEAAHAAGVERFVYLSRLGADRASAYPVLQAKGLAEGFIRQSGVPYLILRSAVLFGQEDIFFNTLAALIQFTPGLTLLPADNKLRLQPLWVQDLATGLEWSLHEPGLLNQTLALGGPEFFTLPQVAEILMAKLGARRAPVGVNPRFLRAGAWFFEQILPRSPLTTHWLDHLAISQLCELTSLTRYFGLRPARLEPTLDYLKERRWLAEVLRRARG